MSCSEFPAVSKLRQRAFQEGRVVNSFWADWASKEHWQDYQCYVCSPKYVQKRALMLSLLSFTLFPQHLLSLPGLLSVGFCWFRVIWPFFAGLVEWYRIFLNPPAPFSWPLTSCQQFGLRVLTQGMQIMMWLERKFFAQFKQAQRVRAGGGLCRHNSIVRSPFRAST